MTPAELAQARRRLVAFAAEMFERWRVPISAAGVSATCAG